MGFGPPQGRPTVTDDEITAIMEPPQRVRTLRNVLDATGDALDETGVALPGARWPRRAGRRESRAAGNDGA